MNADQLAAEYERGYRDGGYQATAAHASEPDWEKMYRETQEQFNKMEARAQRAEQLADTKRLDWWIEHSTYTLYKFNKQWAVYNCDYPISDEFFDTPRQAIDAAMTKEKE